MAERVPVITIDGPGGSGKGTVSRILAQKLGWHFLDSGALYRLVGLAALQRGIDQYHEAALGELADSLDARFDSDIDGIESRIYLEGVDVSDEIRSQQCADMASRVAAIEGVRAALLSRQRGFRQSPGLVADGRDMGTVVFPDAELKIFLDASQLERAKRRHKQLKEKGMDVNLIALLEEIEVRDTRDSARSVSPMKPAADAIRIDTTDKGIAEVVAAILDQWARTHSET